MTVTFLKHKYYVKNEYGPHVMAIGFFDGVHKGHQALIKKAKQQAKALGVKNSVLTFTPHPSEVLNKGAHHKYITPIQEKITRIKNLGIDQVFVIKFDQTFALLSPTSFIEQYINKLNVLHVIIGFDFTFGQNAKGNINTLNEAAKKYNFELFVVSKRKYKNNKISSTIIRQFIKRGKMKHIRGYLGVNYKIKAYTHSTNQKKLQLTTLQCDESYILPKAGMYYVNIHTSEDTFSSTVTIKNNREILLITEQPFSEKKCTIEFINEENIITI